MAESSAADFTVGKIQKDRGQRVAKMYGQQKRNIIHTSSTAYEQDHSAAAPPSSVMNSRASSTQSFDHLIAPAIRGTKRYGISAPSPPQSALMPVNLTTLPHFSVSSAMSLPKSAGESASGALPRSASRILILGSARAALTSV